MDGWTDRLHFSFLGEHVLFDSLRLRSFSDFLVACILAIVLCLSERALTYALSTHWSPFISKYSHTSRVRRALWRTALYWAVTLLRLLYMLVSMTFHVGLILVTATSLALGQFVIEYLDDSQSDRGRYNTHRRSNTQGTKEPLLGPNSPPYDEQERAFALSSISIPSSPPNHHYRHPDSPKYASGYDSPPAPILRPPPLADYDSFGFALQAHSDVGYDALHGVKNSSNPCDPSDSDSASDAHSLRPSRSLSSSSQRQIRSQQMPLSVTVTDNPLEPKRSRKAKPSRIFIHPAASNLARADAAALHRGLGGETERVDAAGGALYFEAQVDDNARGHAVEEDWLQGKGRSMARELLMGGGSVANVDLDPLQEPDERQQGTQFSIGGEEEERMDVEGRYYRPDRH